LGSQEGERLLPTVPGKLVILMHQPSNRQRVARHAMERHAPIPATRRTAVREIASSVGRRTGWDESTIDWQDEIDNYFS
jgi:hypothetical protein